LYFLGGVDGSLASLSGSFSGIDYPQEVPCYVLRRIFR